MNKDELLKLVNNSNSFSEILRKMGKSVSGDAIKLLKNKLDLYGISYHFINEKEISKQIPLNEILVENRPYKAQTLKDRLIKAGLKENKCECCGLMPFWNNKPLILQLDHINGNHNDNRLENLRILCPNCHTQTETFGNKKKYNQKYCLDCGCKIGNKSTYCRKCSPKHQQQPNQKVLNNDRPSKEKLLELITTLSFVKIGNIYNVSDNTIRKWCKKYGLPSTKKELRDINNIYK